MSAMISITPPTFSLPKQLTELGHLAYNLWWSWNLDALRLYRRIDPVLWERVEHNPVRFLQQVARKYLDERKQVLAVVRPEELSPGATKRMGEGKAAGVANPAAAPPEPPRKAKAKGKAKAKKKGR